MSWVAGLAVCRHVVLRSRAADRLPWPWPFCTQAALGPGTFDFFMAMCSGGELQDSAGVGCVSEIVAGRPGAPPVSTYVPLAHVLQPRALVPPTSLTRPWPSPCPCACSVLAVIHECCLLGCLRDGGLCSDPATLRSALGFVVEAGRLRRGGADAALPRLLSVIECHLGACGASSVPAPVPGPPEVQVPVVRRLDLLMIRAIDAACSREHEPPLGLDFGQQGRPLVCFLEDFLPEVGCAAAAALLGCGRARLEPVVAMGLASGGVQAPGGAAPVPADLSSSFAAASDEDRLVLLARHAALAADTGDYVAVQLLYELWADEVPPKSYGCGSYFS